MARSSIAKTASRLRLAIWIVWGGLLAAYLVGRLGWTAGPVHVRAHSTSDPAYDGIAYVSLVLLTIALWQLGRMLGAIAAGDLFSPRVVGSFRAFALWLLVVVLVWVLAPIVMALSVGPGPEHQYEFKLQLRDILTIGVTLILFLVARLLERARAIDEENREIV